MKPTMSELSPRINAGAKVAVAGHLLSGIADTMSSETDTIISAVLLSISCFFFVFAVDTGSAASQNFAALSCAFSVHALLEADIFTNTFVWLASGVGLLALTNCITAYQTDISIYRLSFEAASTYAVALVSFVNDEYAVLTRGLGLLLAGSSLLVFVSIMASGSSTRPFNFVAAGNQFMFGAAVIAHASYYVLLAAEEKTVYAQFVALAVAVSASSVGQN